MACCVSQRVTSSLGRVGVPYGPTTISVSEGSAASLMLASGTNVTPEALSAGVPLSVTSRTRYSCPARNLQFASKNASRSPAISSICTLSGAKIVVSTCVSGRERVSPRWRTSIRLHRPVTQREFNAALELPGICCIRCPWAGVVGLPRGPGCARVERCPRRDGRRLRRTARRAEERARRGAWGGHVPSDRDAG